MAVDVLPPIFTLLRETDHEIVGLVNTLDEVKIVLEEFQKSHMASFVER
jgi:hypothetical protein